MEDWKELWNKNYRGEGDCAELEKFLKSLNYGSRTGVTYLPWAVVERIFKLQDGHYEILKAQDDTIVEVDRTLIREEFDTTSGAYIPKYMNSYFINVAVSWKGQKYTEKYPLQDSNGRALTIWTQNDLNKAIQRAKVKAIANISGIGYKLYEDGDLQFEKDTPTPTDQEKTSTASVAKKAPVEKEELKPKAIEKPQVESEPQEIKIPDKAMPTDRKEIENEIKFAFLRGGEQKTNIIRGFLAENGIAKISQLSEEKVRDLYALVVD